jgi:hypothetical protein
LERRISNKDAVELRGRQEAHWRRFLRWVDEHGDARWVFRGLGDKDFPLTPNVGRKPTYNVADERTLLDVFDRRVTEYRDSGNLSIWDKLTIAQHHGLPTRLLDWSTNPLVAAYFAVTGSPGAIAVKKVSNLRASGSPIFAVPDSRMVEARIVAWNVPARTVIDPKLRDDPFALTEVGFLLPRSLTTRIVSQGGLFSVHPNPKEAWAAPLTRDGNVFDIPGDIRAYFQRKLFYFGVDRQRIMGDIDGICARIAWQYNVDIGLGAVR